MPWLPSLPLHLPLPPPPSPSTLPLPPPSLLISETRTPPLVFVQVVVNDDDVASSFPRLFIYPLQHSLFDIAPGCVTSTRHQLQTEGGGGILSPVLYLRLGRGRKNCPIFSHFASHNDAGGGGASHSSLLAYVLSSVAFYSDEKKYSFCRYISRNECLGQCSSQGGSDITCDRNLTCWHSHHGTPVFSSLLCIRMWWVGFRPSPRRF